MIVRTYNFDISDRLQKLQKGIKNPAQSILIPAAAIIEDDNKRKISQGRKLDETPQKQNKMSTVRKKGHDVPLLDTGLYKNSQWRKNILNKNTVEIQPPPGREDVVPKLNLMGYSTFGISEKAVKMILKFMRKAIDNLIRRYWR